MEIMYGDQGHTLPRSKQFWFGWNPTMRDVTGFQNSYLRCDIYISIVAPPNYLC